MQEFLIVIHRDLTSKKPVPTPEQMKEAFKPYQDWIAGIASSNRLVVAPKRWDLRGKVITATNIEEGPYAEKKSSVGGLFLIKAKDYEEAVAIAKECPIIKYGAVVEVRQAIVA
ncbi:transcription initiation protein [Niastella yeongjuensis]|uniref:Transcription initiation protein n=1 Tax=Niastella yeongjuensis TaxID=354355 RepID=A0A1V9EN17_9BACT|nr:YciI family protein [Niastella yeongjuensis]OQP47471.1 transcription initiation protein [Niastella yeongjuensis]SEN85853.1 YCII-related domain-containing protein [Niastella yeongjuensis]